MNQRGNARTIGFLVIFAGVLFAILYMNQLISEEINKASGMETIAVEEQPVVEKKVRKVRSFNLVETVENNEDIPHVVEAVSDKPEDKRKVKKVIYEQPINNPVLPQ